MKRRLSFNALSTIVTLIFFRRTRWRAPWQWARSVEKKSRNVNGWRQQEQYLYGSFEVLCDIVSIRVYTVTKRRGGAMYAKDFPGDAFLSFLRGIAPFINYDMISALHCRLLLMNPISFFLSRTGGIQGSVKVKDDMSNPFPFPFDSLNQGGEPNNCKSYAPKSRNGYVTFHQTHSHIKGTRTLCFYWLSHLLRRNTDAFDANVAHLVPHCLGSSQRLSRLLFLYQ